MEKTAAWISRTRGGHAWGGARVRAEGGHPTFFLGGSLYGWPPPRWPLCSLPATGVG